MPKKDIHPKYYPNATVTCACGNTFTTGSTKPELRVDVCHKCHPFYTGEERIIDTGGTIERFKRKQKEAALKQKAKRRKQETEKMEERKTEKQPRTLRELLEKS